MVIVLYANVKPHSPKRKDANMRLQIVKTTACCHSIQCSQCFKMSHPTIADLDAKAGTYYCEECVFNLPLSPHMQDNMKVSLMIHSRAEGRDK